MNYGLEMCLLQARVSERHQTSGPEWRLLSVIFAPVWRNLDRFQPDNRDFEPHIGRPKRAEQAETPTRCQSANTNFLVVLFPLCQPTYGAISEGSLQNNDTM